MALLFMDSFDHYVTADLPTKWNSTSGTVAINATAGRRGGGGVRIASGGLAYLTKSLAPANNTLILGVAVKLATVTGIAGLVDIYQSSTRQILCMCNASGGLEVRRDYYAGALLGTAANAFSAGTYSYIEIKITIHASAGTVDVRVNGISAVSATGLNTSQSGVNAYTSINLGNNSGTGSTPQIDYDDLYIADSAGAAPWNTFLGDCRVDARIPTGAGATTGWTPSAGSNYQNVDDATPNGDTDYNSTATVGLTDTFVTQDAPVVGATIFGIQHCLSLKKMDAGTCSVAPVVRHSGTDYVGTDISPSTSYAYGLLVQQTNPGTGAPWTEAGFNAAEFGYKKTA
jgi:hypothetical protein